MWKILFFLSLIVFAFAVVRYFKARKDYKDTKNK